MEEEQSITTNRNDSATSLSTSTRHTRASNAHTHPAQIAGVMPRRKRPNGTLKVDQAEKLLQKKTDDDCLAAELTDALKTMTARDKRRSKKDPGKSSLAPPAPPINTPASSASDSNKRN